MRNKGLVTILLIAILLHAMYVWYTYTLSKGAQVELLEENQGLTLLIQRLKTDLNETNQRLDDLESALKGDAQLSESMAQQLLQNGHGDPERFIREALMKQTNVIQSQPVLGGTFYIYKCVLLKDNLAWIAFEDGHVAGFALWQFSYNSVTDSIEVIRLFEMIE